MIENLLDNFPTGFEPHERQEKIITNVEQAFNEGYKFVVISAPTGTGKSHIAKTLGNHSPAPPREFVSLVATNLAFKQDTNGYMHAGQCSGQKSFGTMLLTITKSLQDQYTDLFSDIKSMKGQSNYICAVDDEYTVDMAPCLFTKGMKKKCQAEYKCPYYNARIKGLTARTSALNYKMFFNLPEHVKKREYIICDEASELEDELVKQFTCIINFDALKKLKVNIDATPTNSYAQYERWASSLMGTVYSRMTDMQEILADRKIDKKVSEKYRKYLAVLQMYHNNLITLIDTFHDSEYQIEKCAKEIKFIPLKVDKLAKYIFDNGEKIVLMSATIIDHANFAKVLGIDKYKYIEVDSPFEAENAPIFCSNLLKLSHKNIDQSLGLICKQVAELCKKHENDKGIIHTHSNKITKALQDSFFLESRFLYREPGVTNEDLLFQHGRTTEPTILVSPSMSYGVDLKGDLARFQIIIKAPYSPLGDVRIQKMFELDKQWYLNKMLGSVIQACGRGVRSPNDKCVTYILDGVILDAILRNKHKLPKYFIDRFM
jgi:Rad3-related DNA helicase